MSFKMETTTKRHNASCAPVPDFTRLSYFYGQMLSAQDFQREQDYFREKLKLHNRCLHGYGVVCGLAVTPEPLDLRRCAYTAMPEADVQRFSARLAAFAMTRRRNHRSCLRRGDAAGEPRPPRAHRPTR